MNEWRWAVIRLLITPLLLVGCALPPSAPTPSRSAAVAWRSITETSSGVRLARLISLAVTPDGALWIGSDRDGVFCYDGANWQQYRSADGLADDSAQRIALGPDGAVWVATWYGVSRHEGDRWHTYPLDDDFVGGHYYALAVAPNGDVWLGGARGLLRLEDGRWRPAIADDELARLPVLALAAGPDGVLWVAAGLRGVYRLQGDEVVFLGPPASPRGLRVRALLLAPEGVLWVGTSHGLFRYWRDGWQRPQDGLPDAYVTSLALAPDGALWLGTYGDGLLRYDGEQVTRYSLAQGLPDAKIPAVAVAADGTVWAATAGGLVSGLSR